MNKAYALLIMAILCMVSGCQDEPHPLYQKYQYPNEQYFGADVYSELFYECTDDERDSVAPLMETAEEIFSYVGPKVDKEVASDTVGALSRYYVHTDIASEQHMVELITVKLEDRTGVMWVAYYHTAWDSDGELVYGSGSKSENILARWELEQIDGAWCVIGANEAP